MVLAQVLEQRVAAQRHAHGMPAGVRDAAAHGLQQETDLGRVAGIVGARQAVGRAGAAAKMGDGHDPAARPEMMRDRLRVAAVAAAFQAVEQHQRRRVRRVRQGFPVRVGHPARGGGPAIGDRTLAAYGAPSAACAERGPARSSRSPRSPCPAFPRGRARRRCDGIARTGRRRRFGCRLRAATREQGRALCQNEQRPTKIHPVSSAACRVRRASRAHPLRWGRARHGA